MLQSRARDRQHETAHETGPCSSKNRHRSASSETSCVPTTQRSSHRRSAPDSPATSQGMNSGASCGASAATVGWASGGPTEYGGQGRPATDQFIFFDETRRAGAPFPFVTVNTVGPTIMRFGTPRAEGALPSRDPLGGRPLRHRVHGAGSGHRPRLAADPGGARRRRVRDQRQQGLHQRRGRRGLHLAGHADGSGGSQAQGHLDHLRAHHDAGVRVEPDPHGRGEHDHRHLLQGRPRSREHAGGRGERRLADDHDAAQPRAGWAGGVERRRPSPSSRTWSRGLRGNRPATGGRCWTSSGSSTTSPSPTPSSRP